MDCDKLLRTAVVRKADDPLIKGLTIQSSYETSAEGAKAGGRGGHSWNSCDEALIFWTKQIVLKIVWQRNN